MHDGFVNLRVSEDSNIADLRKLSRVWQTHDNVTMDVESMSLEEVRRLTLDILPHLPDSFMEGVLCEFATIPELPDDLVRLIFAHGDMECKIAVALREKLPEELHAACQNTSDDDVREHYFQKHGAPNIRGHAPPSLFVTDASGYKSCFLLALSADKALNLKRAAEPSTLVGFWFQGFMVSSKSGSGSLSGSIV